MSWGFFVAGILVAQAGRPSDGLPDLISDLQFEHQPFLEEYQRADPFLDLVHAGRGTNDRLLQLSPSRCSESFRAILERGHASIPTLLLHFEDARPTPTVVAVRSDAKLYFGGEFAGVGGSIQVAPPADKTSEWLERYQEEGYRYRVGDLCLVAIGLILNRDYRVIEHQPSRRRLFFSPVDNRSIATTLSLSLGDRSPGVMVEQLRLDAIIPSGANSEIERSLGAIARLVYYDVEDAPEVLLRWLSVVGLKRPEWVPAFCAKVRFSADARFHAVLDAAIEQTSEEWIAPRVKIACVGKHLELAQIRAVVCDSFEPHGLGGVRERALAVAMAYLPEIPTCLDAMLAENKFAASSFVVDVASEYGFVHADYVPYVREHLAPRGSLNLKLVTPPRATEAHEGR